MTGPRRSRGRRRLRRLKRANVLAHLAGMLGRPLNALLRRHTPSPEICGLPLGLNTGATNPQNPRLVFISDIHAGPTLSWTYLDRVAQRIEALRPHALLLGGDYLTTSARALDGLLARLAPIPAPGGKFAVLGNHDHDFDTHALHRHFAQAGITLLVNEGARIELGTTSIWVAGIDDYRRGRPDLARALEGRAAGEFRLLLSHNPDFVCELAPGAVDVMLSGHTHAGQICPFGTAVVSNSEFGMKYLAGLVTGGPCPVYVSRGIGTVQIALRWAAQAEITVLEIGGDTTGFPD